jgi:peptidoglycan/xylan/chitin deacetylase (PgdA/CDA1 family)
MSARFFIRNDDVWTLDREFRFFFDLALERDLPVIYAVIPGKMERGLVRFLCQAKERTPHLLDIVQHGWLHENHSRKVATKYEFGPSRAYGAQQEDIRQGFKKMRMAFGENFIPAFVPPYHGYDQRTFRVLHEEGFRVLSAGHCSSQKSKGLIEMPAQVSFSCYEKGRPKIKNAREVVRTLARGIYGRALSGIVTHHEDFSNAVFRKQLMLFFDCIVALKAKEGWRPFLFSDILSESKGVEWRCRRV